MRPQTRKRTRAVHTDHSRVSRAPRSQLKIEGLVTEILTDLARVLVVSGYGVTGVSRLAKRAYLIAAQTLEHDSPRKANHARIAALTGLTRAEVSRLSRERVARNAQGLLPASRAQRVSFGWATDPDYCDRPGTPKVLPFSRSRKSFESLVKRYSGDIPARAMFLEMKRLGMTEETESKTIRLIRLDAPIKQETVTALDAMRPWANFLADSNTDESRNLNANTVRLQISFESLPQLFSAVRELQDRATAFVANIRELGAGDSARNPHKLQVSIALATRVPRVSGTVRRKVTGKNHVES
jgi:hypothetical protein